MSMGEEQLRVIIEDDDAGTAKSIDREIAESKRRTEGKLAEAARARAEVQRGRMKSPGCARPQPGRFRLATLG